MKRKNKHEEEKSTKKSGTCKNIFGCSMCKDCGNNCDYSDCYKWSCNRNKDILDKATKNAQKIVKAFFEKIMI